MANETGREHQLRRRFGGVLYNGAPPRATRMLIEPQASHENTGVRFALDRRFEGEVSVNWSGLPRMPDLDEMQSLNWSLAALIAQHALPTAIDSQGLGNCAMVLGDILSMLYRIRGFCDETPQSAVPLLPLPASRPSARPGSQDSGGSRRVLLMLSGGFDSAAAALLLREAGFEVIALHISANRHVERAEETAARSVAEALDIPFYHVDLHFPDQERIGRYYSRSFGQYPFYNSVPHGRDFPLAIIGTIVARQLNCSTLAFGHEKESRGKVIETDQGPVFRHDVESAHGRDLVQRYIDDTLASGVSVMSPIAGISIYRIRKFLMLQHPEIARLVQSCFWSRSCGRCLKCASTYTMQRHLGVELSSFSDNPFSDPDDVDMALFAHPDRPSEALGYGPQMHYAMCRLVEDSKLQDDDYWLSKFKADGLTRVKSRWAQIESICLDISHPSEVPSEVQTVIQRTLGVP